jgi:two-component system sensor histidine kinase UhpB
MEAEVLSAGRAAARPTRGPLARLARVPVLYKILGANAVIVVLGAVVGTAVSLRHGAAHPGATHYDLVAGFVMAGIGLSLVANYLVLRTVLRPLEHLQRAVDAVRAGTPGVRVERRGLTDERFEHLADTFDGMVVALEEHAARLRRLPGRILRAQEEERRRIARELHDEAAQSITSLLVRLRLLERAGAPEVAQQRVQELRELTMLALDDVRRIAVELRPSVLDDLGLVAALRAHVDAVNAAGGVAIGLAVAGMDGRLPPEVELALYRVAQEAITNARRHAQASRAAVRLIRDGAHVVLEVTDDGVGFDPAAVQAGRGGLGLAGMRERLALIGGDLALRSAPGRGTTVTARVAVEA